MTLLRLLLVAACFLSAGALSAQEGKLHPLASNVVLDGMIVVLDAPEKWDHDSETVDVVWDSPEGRRFLFADFARAGRHGYDPRAQPSWRGSAAWVSANTTGAFKFPSLADEWDIFMAPERWRPTTVNALRGHRFFACSWDVLLLLVLVAAALAFYFVARCAPAVALLGGFALAWVALDLRTMTDHFFIVSALEEQRRPLPILTEAKAFSDRAAEVIGPGSWALDHTLSAHPLAAHYFGYAFAEHRYVPIAQADYLVALEPAQGAMVWQHGPYRLLKRDAP
jgi:hypothetical protein